MLEILLYKIKSYFTLLMCSVMPTVACATASEPPETLNLNLPTGFKASVYAKLSSKPRLMAFDTNGDLLISAPRSNQILKLTDTNNDGVAEVETIISEGLNAPHGLAFVKDGLLIANQDSVVKVRKTGNKWSKPAPIISGLATGGHTLKTIKIGADNHLYINVGSSCNVCNEGDPTRATILRYTLTGEPAGALAVVGRHTSLPPIWAKGLRNSQGFAWHPDTGAMFATNNGSDMRSETKGGAVNDELPPEHINKIERGNHYGWPHCWGDNSTATGVFTDPNFTGADGFCATTTPPAIMLTSHSTPIGITFLDKSHFPKEFKGDAIVALHGSWNREQLSGYKLVRIHFKYGKPVKATDFATGWLNNNQAWGRPVDVAVGHDGALYVTDDRTGYVYRITYDNSKPVK